MYKKRLTDADLGWGKTSHQTHIGLHEDMLDNWSNVDKDYPAYLFIDNFDNCFHCTGTINAIVDGATGKIRSPKIKVGSSPENTNLNKLIRKNATELRRYLSLGMLPNKTLFAFLSNGNKEAESIIKSTDLDVNSKTSEYILLPKPFLLLAGISGTGKTRFVRKQAELSAELFELNAGENYCLIPVRPDWHEPSDLLGYISRINGTKYIATDFLKFMIQAITASIKSVDEGEIKWKPFSEVPPFWLCLDEMNLAPVEQYFADYLSILETRKWENNEYSSEPMMKADVLKRLDKNKTDNSKNSLEELWDELFDGINIDFKENLCDYFKSNGIPLPPNLIVAGTVNMDETTHGFSRKVIDRALTIDFQEFFPNDYNAFLNSDDKNQLKPKQFSFPTASSAVAEESKILIEGLDNDTAEKSRDFLNEINLILKNTPFELAYRALNEILLAVSCFSPYEGDEAELKLKAVWDDFLMQKVLPRIEGDIQKLKSLLENGAKVLESEYLTKEKKIYGKGSILHQLYALLETDQLGDIWGNEENKTKRPDLLRDTDDKIECRSKKKLLWMMKRLKVNHFTDFWV